MNTSYKKMVLAVRLVWTPNVFFFKQSLCSCVFLISHMPYSTSVNTSVSDQNCFIFIYIIYNAKRESVKEYKYFFYQYSAFHVFTKQSSVENFYQHTNCNTMVLNKNDVNPGRHPGLRHTRRTKPYRKNIQR